MRSVETSVKVVRPVGALTSANVDAFKEEMIHAITSTSANEVAIDMAAVDSVDNSGLIALLAGCDTAKRHRKRLSLCDVAPRVRIVFELAQLDRAVSMVDSQELQAA
ncbi:anti-sigma-factor antagonist [Leptolyngbya sp. Heron Island J]|uniref:STAS domain-containing protein n=1 Tax=Leptolyngbya sp. Heron Island J TaxID=1385935 RepID=UPI0003B9A4E1|nr:STAS domain-containing protein [Leptolyngbya sp. Heron Island J]ESA31986.1 anti-sigma-factor antagonist [Leptolyngbya sp. Heron Island J]